MARLVARLRTLLEVVRAQRGGRALAREHGFDAGVRPEPPAGAGGGVDRLAHDRVTEAEPPRGVGRADQVRGEQLVERAASGSSSSAAAAASSGPNGSAATAAPCASVRASGDSASNSSVHES